MDVLVILLHRRASELHIVISFIILAIYLNAILFHLEVTSNLCLGKCFFHIQRSMCAFVWACSSLRLYNSSLIVTLAQVVIKECVACKCRPVSVCVCVWSALFVRGTWRNKWSWQTNLNLTIRTNQINYSVPAFFVHLSLAPNLERIQLKSKLRQSQI